MNRAGFFDTVRIRLIVFVVVAILHITLILFGSFRIEAAAKTVEPVAGVMRLVDVREEAPLPPERPPEILQATNEAIAETMIETGEISPPVTSLVPVQNYVVTEQIEYLPQHRISTRPLLPEDEIARAIVYPPRARRSNIEGIVRLELFIDRQGNITDLRLLREDPPRQGFGEAALHAFRGIRAIRPAEINGVPVAVRFRYDLRFTLR